MLPKRCSNPRRRSPNKLLSGRALPNIKELVSLKIDSDVLALFQEDGPGWQDRINDTLRAAMKNRL